MAGNHKWTDKLGLLNAVYTDFSKDTQAKLQFFKVLKLLLLKRGAVPHRSRNGPGAL
jgi:hypothetical protein